MKPRGIDGQLDLLPWLRRLGRQTRRELDAAAHELDIRFCAQRLGDQRFGVDDLPGTPNLLVLTAQGELVNGDTATTWRNSASRSETEIHDELAMLAKATAPNAQ